MSEAKKTMMGSTRVTKTKPHGSRASDRSPKMKRAPESADVIAALRQEQG